MKPTEKMLDTIEGLQRALYSNWQEDSMGCRPEGRYCRFCDVRQPQPHIEYHMPDCQRLDYLAHYYGIKPRKPKKSRYRHVVVDGKEFVRSGVYGWWRNKGELKPLLDRAFAIERESK